jgi:hypothetical protein
MGGARAGVLALGREAQTNGRKRKIADIDGDGEPSADGVGERNTRSKTRREVDKSIGEGGREEDVIMIEDGDAARGKDDDYIPG